MAKGRSIRIFIDSPKSPTHPVVTMFFESKLYKNCTCGPERQRSPRSLPDLHYASPHIILFGAFMELVSKTQHVFPPAKKSQH